MLFTEITYMLFDDINYLILLVLKNGLSLAVHTLRYSQRTMHHVRSELNRSCVKLETISAACAWQGNINMHNLNISMLLD